MPYRKCFLVVSAIIFTVATLNMSLKEKRDNRSKAVEMVAQLYSNEMHHFDQFLKQYPIYFYDSSYEARKSAYEELARRIKKIECLFYYYHPQLALEKFFLVGKLEKRDVGLPFPDSWILGGPFGIETDSEIKKMKPERVDFSKMFIARAAANFRKVIEESNYNRDCEAMSERDIFEALRLQIIRISTIGLSNGDLTVEPPGMPGLEGEYTVWTDMVKIFLEQLASNSTLKKQMLAKIDAGKSILDTKPAFRKFDRMNFLKEILIPPFCLPP